MKNLGPCVCRTVTSQHDQLVSTEWSFTLCPWLTVLRLLAIWALRVVVHYRLELLFFFFSCDTGVCAADGVVAHCRTCRVHNLRRGAPAPTNVRKWTCGASRLMRRSSSVSIAEMKCRAYGALQSAPSLGRKTSRSPTSRLDDSSARCSMKSPRPSSGGFVFSPDKHAE